MFEVTGKYGTAKVFSINRDAKAVDQIQTLMDQPFIAGSKVRIMPDYHWGAGCTIGFTANLGDYIIPNLVGVDIGCGMYVESLGKVNFDLKEFDHVVHKIPAGFKSWKNPVASVDFMRELIAWPEIKNSVIDVQVGTLGGGNHFIELDRDEETGEIYLVIHSGSRNIGKQIAEHYQRIAERACKADVPRQLKYLTGEEAAMYLHDMALCQRYAAFNRQTICTLISDHFEVSGDSFQTIHNYINPQDHIIRKGAVSARKGERLIIPLNMRDGSILATGKGNPDWNYSAPHGAGRLLGRKEAQRTLRMDEFKRSMKGIFSTTIAADTLDEAPLAYKPAREILDAVNDTVAIEAWLKPIYNFKAGRE